MTQILEVKIPGTSEIKAAADTTGIARLNDELLAAEEKESSRANVPKSSKSLKSKLSMLVTQ